MTDPKARIDGVVAAKAAVAVVFRRGPSAVTQLLVWNLDTDEVRPGPWIKASVYTRRCDLSPNGRYLVGFYSNFDPARIAKAAKEHGLKEPKTATAWTAVSFADSFTPLALWYQPNTYFGGGFWVANAKVEVHAPNAGEPAVPPPGDVTAKRMEMKGPDAVGFVWRERLEKRGWRRIKGAKRTLSNPNVAMQWFKDAPKGRLLYESTRTDDAGDETWTLTDPKGVLIRRWETDPSKPMFIDFDARGRLVYGEAGCLYAWANWPDEEPRMIADLNANVYKGAEPATKQRSVRP